MKRTLLIVILLIFTCSETHCFASVNREQLAHTVQNECNDVLLALVALNNAETHAPTAVPRDIKQKISQRAQSFAGTLYHLPITDVDDSLAVWIEQSMVAEIKGLGLGFLNDPADDAAFPVYRRDAETRFKTLDNAKGRQLLQRRDILLKRGDDYNRSLENFLVGKLTRIQILQIDGGDPQIEQLEMAINTLGSFDNKKLDSLPKPSAFRSGLLDLRDQDIDSRIMTLSLLREMQQKMHSYDVIDWYSYGSIVSPIFAQGDARGSLLPKRFDEVSPRIEQLYEECMTVKGDITQFQYGRFLHFLGTACLVLPFHMDTPSHDHDPAGRSVIFRNDATVWQLLPSRNSPLAQLVITYH